MNKVSTYIVGWMDEDTNWHTEYIQALDPTQAVDALGIPADMVQEVAMVIDNWQNKPRYTHYTLTNGEGSIITYKATSADNAISRARRTFGGSWHVAYEFTK